MFNVIRYTNVPKMYYKKKKITVVLITIFVNYTAHTIYLHTMLYIYGVGSLVFFISFSNFFKQKIIIWGLLAVHYCTSTYLLPPFRFLSSIYRLSNDLCQGYHRQTSHNQVTFPKKKKINRINNFIIICIY